MILAVDTSLGTAVALIDDDGTRLSDASAADPLGHAEVIGELLVRALGETGSGSIDHVVAGMGPGPFTGLRIGIATARTFAMGRGIPVVPVPSHFAAALTAIDRDAVTGPFAIVTDARRREVAVTVFEGTDADGIPNMVADTVLVARVDADEHLGGIRRIDVETLSAVDLARVGARAVAAGRTLAGAEPLYLRQPDVTVPGAPKKVGR
ncbi:tRNA (adenosine(37)-N6)-threonylcarbamoyltransferase complex dimerization subunit type 1 TsaB [Microbacterium foliorum]|uniref:tRNA (adenosine(37)-N6)-threonylcarbamoyltransferase complex dimerization subunit type 1 TsaB n=1 Tax=Microbacterium TaxID=33882 RepID=UPI0005AC0A69|nr:MULTISPECIES: tRNA (adenosine(37)-N6)-threonylcarbamoyltransferase complex dimerization subunit type 1 TsaB [Microbacterium]AQY00813.1 tRNA (adenosine(37)-N6)-threonylcarbamoyltransferase complex dimerization subunit type 1 TsaB [Microbacterium foliorum]KIP92707.1 peptidase [Microbacterium sp. MEJ108Y]